LGPGEILSSPTQNYKILGVAGKGAYSTVFRASRTTDGLNVAIKVLRNNPTTHRAGMKESGILEKIFDSDEQSRRFIVELIENVKVKGHYCLVFEALGMNLRDLLQKYGKGVGLKVSAIQIYARQAFAALAILRKCNVIHADIKPDNVLVSEKLNTAKICDFGTAMTAPFNDLVPYLASRFYRAPEIGTWMISDNVKFV
jgi:serine/threonine-protein kinase PRP4